MSIRLAGPLLGLTLLCLLACKDAGTVGVVTLKAASAPYEITVLGKGSLRAVKATPIIAPRTKNGANTISWLLPEGSFAKEGDVLVRFDEAGLKVKQEESKGDLATLDYRMNIDGRLQGLERDDLDGKIYVLGEERQQAEQFRPKDVRLYMRNEIIESEVNLNFLNIKVDHFGQKKDRQQLKSQTQSEIHTLTKEGQERELQQVEENLQNLVTRAPHDGYFYYERNWRDEPTRVGQFAWTSMKLGELPDLNLLEAKIYVLEKEASGLKVDLDVEVTLDARPGFPYKGKIKNVATLAKAIDRETPINYFEVIVSLDATDLDFMRPGGLVSGKVFIDRQDKVVALPNQVFFHGDGENWLYVVNGADFEKRMVKLGKRGPTRTVVEEGLNEGEEVALSNPTGEKGK